MSEFSKSFINLLSRTTDILINIIATNDEEHVMRFGTVDMSYIYSVPCMNQECQVKSFRDFSNFEHNIFIEHLQSSLLFYTYLIEDK